VLGHELIVARGIDSQTNGDVFTVFQGLAGFLRSLGEVTDDLSIRPGFRFQQGANEDRILEDGFRHSRIEVVPFTEVIDQQSLGRFFAQPLWK
jgi:hypothetical protein